MYIIVARLNYNMYNRKMTRLSIISVTFQKRSLSIDINKVKLSDDYISGLICCLIDLSTNGMTSSWNHDVTLELIYQNGTRCTSKNIKDVVDIVSIYNKLAIKSTDFELAIADNVLSKSKTYVKIMAVFKPLNENQTKWSLPTEFESQFCIETNIKDFMLGYYNLTKLFSYYLIFIPDM